MASTTTDLDIVPLAPAIGAEIRGLDLRDDLSRETVDRIKDAWHRHIVLLFRGQSLDEDQQVRFAGLIGPIAERGRPVERRHEDPSFNPTFTLITNIRKDGKPIGSLPDGEMYFHHDTCYYEVPHRASFLYAIEIPSTGGNTLFASMYAAYDDLPRETKNILDGRTVLQVYDYDRPVNQRFDISGGLDGLRHFSHPAVLTHPITGGKALYVNRLMTARIEGLPQDESDALLDELFDHGERRELIYEHVWRPGDLLMWDNLCSTHARTDFPAGETRLLRRCVIKGEPLSG